jgi:VWFA-related protein
VQFRSAVIAPVLFSLLGATAFADRREVTNVEVVQVPVYVTRDGASVTGLTKDNFALFVNGKPQGIDYFDVIDFAAPAAPAPMQPEGTPPPLRDVRQRRLYVLLFDLVYSTPKTIARAQVAADGYVERAGDSDYFAVGTYTSNHGIQLMVPFTRDRVAARHAIQTLAEPSTSDPLRLAIQSAERAETVTPDKFAESAQTEQFIEDSVAAQMVKDPLRRLISDEVQDLSDFADRLSPIEGNRHVVLLTAGFDSTLVHGAGPANTIGFPQSFGRNGQMNAPVRSGWKLGASEPGVTHALREMYGRFTRAGVFLDCIDVAGNRASMSSSHESEGLSILARDTGGQVVLNRNDLGEAIQHLANMQRVVYLLSFHARDTGRKDNAIAVKVRDVPAAQITYRPSYSTSLPKASTVDGLRLADILENDIPQTGVSTAVTTAGKNVDVEIPTRELLALAGHGTADAEVLIYVYSGRSVVGFQDKRVTIDPARADATRPLHLVASFDLPAGRFTAKVLVRVEGADVLGFAHAEMNVE